MGKYDDIIQLPHHVSATRPHMSMSDRAAQFMPFRALTGYGDAVQEAARLTEERIELADDEKSFLDRELQRLSERIGQRPQVTLAYFQPDSRKSGGAYVAITGRLKRIDDTEGLLLLLDGERIPIDALLRIQGQD